MLGGSLLRVTLALGGAPIELVSLVESLFPPLTSGEELQSGI